MKNNVIIGKWNFEVEIDDNIKSHIEEIKEEHEEVQFCKVYTEDESTVEQVNSDCDNMINLIESLMEGGAKLEEVVNNHSKKANGTFGKGRVSILYNAKYTSVLWEDSYCYATYAIRAKSVSDTKLVISLEHEKNTW